VEAYRCSVQVASRSSGRSAAAAAAYRASVELHDHRQGLVHDYIRKQDIAHCEILQPAGSPAFFADSEKLWNGRGGREEEGRATGARSRKMLPRELNQAENLALLRDYVAEQFVARGMVADLSLDTGYKALDGKAQPHAHIMLTMRGIGPDGFGKKVREWNDKDQLAMWREARADQANRSLECAGRDERGYHRTLAAQREDALQRGDTDKAEKLTREPVGKVPVATWQMEQRGVKTGAGDRRRPAKGRNEQYREWGRQLAEVRAQIAERLREVGRWPRIRSWLRRTSSRKRWGAIGLRYPTLRRLKIGNAAMARVPILQQSGCVSAWPSAGVHWWKSKASR
jgi:hypothetical protein